MSTLTEQQERAVARRDGSLLLAAGAGSGKTSVLVERFVRAVCEDGISPARILAISFTDRAAGELRERIRQRLLALGERTAACDAQAAFVGTFHGFCARVLRAHALVTGLDPEFTILEESLAGRLREQAFADALRRFLDQEPRAKVDLLAAYGPDRVRRMIEDVYTELRSRGQRRPRLPVADARLSSDEPRSCKDALGLSACALLDELLDSFGSRYEQLKRVRAALDFDDLELHARGLLERDARVRSAWSARFELLMVDEFQDTNPRQLAILCALERENLFTVGDERQAIYGFRHADVRLFRARATELGERGASLELTRNFRSRPALLEVVNAAFTARSGGRYAPLVPAREAASEDRCEPPVELLLTSRRGWEQADGPASREHGSTPAWRCAEARMLAGRVAELVSRAEARPGEIVILLRALGDLDVYEGALRERGLRTLAPAGGFWRSQQVGDLLCYLRALANPLDELALYATLASPLVGLSSDGLALLARASGAHGENRLWATLQSGAGPQLARMAAADRAALVKFGERFERERRSMPMRTISELIGRELDASGYRAHLLSLQWSERRLANVHKLLRLARRFEASEGRDLRGFLDHARRLTDAPSAAEPDAPFAAIEPDAVRLMSIHAAKGLEFPVVCLADLGRAQNLSVSDLLVDGARMGVRLVELDGGEATPSVDYESLCEERRRLGAEEEDRVLYVAMTRARDRLLLSGAVDFERWPQPRQGAPAISWLAPALATELPAIALAHAHGGGEPVRDVAVGADGGSVRCRLNVPDLLSAGESKARARPTAPRGSVAQAPAAQAPAAQAPAAQAPAARHPPAQHVAALHGTAQHGADGAAGAFEQIGSLSYTALRELERCGYRFYAERVLGLEQDRSARRRAGSSSDGLQARVRGTLVHRLMESIDFARPVAPSPDRVAMIARELGVRVSRRERVEIVALVRAACGALEEPGTAVAPAPGARVAAAESVRREHPFAFSLGPREPLLTGVIDLIAREPDGGLLVVDYKTDRVDPDAELAALTEREYGLQRMLYALAVLRDGAPAVEIVHWFLQRPHDWVSVRYGAGAKGELEEQLAGLIERARAGTFSVSERPHRDLCEACPARRLLCSWSEAETLRESTAPARVQGRLWAA